MLSRSMIDVKHECNRCSKAVRGCGWLSVGIVPRPGGREGPVTGPRGTAGGGASLEGMRSILLFSLLRLAVFAVAWFLLAVLMPSVPWIWTGILAAVIAMLVSILLLGKQRQQVTEEMQRRGAERRAKAEKKRAAGRRSVADEDAEAEDAVMDARESAGDR